MEGFGRKAGKFADDVRNSEISRLMKPGWPSGNVVIQR